MSTAFADIEKLAFGLSEKQRIRLVSSLLRSLPSPWDDDDDGMAEAIRRDREMDENPDSIISHEEFMKSFDKYRR